MAPPASNFVAMPENVVAPPPLVHAVPAMEAVPSDISVNNNAPLDPLRILFGVVGAPSKEDLIARLQAAAYDTYYD